VAHPREHVDLLLLHAASLVTMDRGAIPRRGPEAREIGSIEDGAVAVSGEWIVAVGKTDEILSRYETEPENEQDLTGCTVLPGFIDAHTHVLFAGSREREFEMRLDGRTYMEIAAAGGGILSSVRAFREASDEDLLTQTSARLDRMLALGTTTIEAKSGYGLAVEPEIRALRLIDRLDDQHPSEIVGTLLGAHAIPPEYRDSREKYVSLVIEEMIPRAAAETRVRFCDVFCEKGVFTPEETRAILVEAREHGLEPRLHADEFAASGAAELAAELTALSADHLMAASEEGLGALAASGRTVAILLPSTSLSLGAVGYAPARRMIEMGIPVAIATDCNPGSSMTMSLPLAMTLAVLQMKMSVAEALNAVTVNAAASLGMSDEIGRIATGTRADLLVLPTSTPAGIIYRLGDLPPLAVFKSGRLVAAEGSRIE
jgi:imidazolonepropionase